MNEEFEKWAESEGFDLERDFEAPENYVCEKTGAALIGWQASRKQALEEATAAAFHAWTVAADVGEQANDMINAIRSLQKE